MPDTDLVVVGGGITGLAAAWEALGRGATVTVLESLDTPGGKLRTSPVAGIQVDESADAFLARVPEAIDLCAELGIEAELVSPSTGRAYVWAGSELRPLPQDQLLGVPTDLDAVAASGILSPEGLARAADDLAQGGDDPAPTGDEAIGELVRRHLGDEVHDRLVAPLIGGIWAGDCDQLSVEVAAPTLAEARRRDTSLIRGARAVRAAAMANRERAGQPVFLTPRGGMSRLVDALTGKLGERVRLGQPVEKIASAGTAGTGWRIEPAGVTAASVVVATPAPTAAGLVAPHSQGAAEILAGIDHASVSLVTLAVPRDGIDHPMDGSGFLVPASAGLVLTACSWASSKWAHLTGDDAGGRDSRGGAGDVVLVRASAGRYGDDRAMRLDHGDLLEALRADLRLTMGLHAEPIDVRIGRWHHSFPQPRPGHLGRVAELEQALAQETRNLAVAGAWARGVGIPACIRSGRQAAIAVLE